MMLLTSTACCSNIAVRLLQWAEGSRQELLIASYGRDDEHRAFSTLTERRVDLRERAAIACIPKIVNAMVVRHELHAREFVVAARNFEEMQYRQ